MSISPEQRQALGAQLREGLAQMAIDLSPAQQSLLLDYLGLLEKWNRSYNLTAIKDPADMVVRHLLDSLSILPYFAGTKTAIDVGTGGGLPGIPLAIACPDTRIDLLDSNGKKTRFLFQVKAALGLDNIKVHHSRVEKLAVAKPYDVVLSRAFASLVDMVDYSARLQAPEGCLMAMKGQQPDSELTALPSSVTVCACYSLDIFGLNEQRHLVVLKSSGQHPSSVE